MILRITKFTLDSIHFLAIHKMFLNLSELIELQKNSKNSYPGDFLIDFYKELSSQDFLKLCNFNII